MIEGWAGGTTGSRCAITLQLGKARRGRAFHEVRCVECGPHGSAGRAVAPALRANGPALSRPRATPHGADHTFGSHTGGHRAEQGRWRGNGNGPCGGEVELLGLQRNAGPGIWIMAVPSQGEMRCVAISGRCSTFSHLSPKTRFRLRRSSTCGRSAVFGRPRRRMRLLSSRPSPKSRGRRRSC